MPSYDNCARRPAIVPQLCKQWCADSEGNTEPLTSRLVDFAKARWTNPAFHQMVAALFCDPGAEFCEPEYAVRTTLWELYIMVMQTVTPTFPPLPRVIVHNVNQQKFDAVAIHIGII